MRTRRETEELPAPTASVVGCLEVLNESGIYGWAYDSQDLARPTTIQLRIDDDFVCELACTGFRPDVEAAGHPRSEVGFVSKIPESFCDGVRHSLRFETLDGNVLHLWGIISDTNMAEFCFDTYFDYEFYRIEYPDAANLGAQTAYSQWLSNDCAPPRYPNSSALISNLEKQFGPLPEGFSPQRYRFLNSDLGEELQEDWQTACHFLRLGRSSGRQFDFSDKGFLVDLYFGGVEPPHAVMSTFVSTNSSTLYTSLSMLLSRNSIVSDTFLKYLNVPDYAANVPGQTFRTRLSCIRHFAETGLAAGTPLSFDATFVSSFAAEIDSTYEDLSAPDAYLRWINVGVDAQTPPNPASFLTRLGLSDTRGFPASFDFEMYLARNPDLREVVSNRWNALKHLIETGLIEKRAGCPLSAGTVDIYCAVADRLAIAGRLAAARQFYEAVLSECPDNMAGLRHYGDCLLRDGEFYLAAQIYETTITQDRDNVWTHLNLVICYTRLNRWTEACASIQRVCKARPGDRALQRRFREVLASAYESIAADALWLATNKFYERARLRIREACELLKLPLVDNLERASRLNGPVSSVTIIADLGLPQCKFYRVDQKVEQIEALGLECRLVDYRSDIFKFARESAWTDIVILYRVPATPDIMWSISLFRRANIPVIYEIDDLMFDSDVFPDSFESYGGQISHDLYATLITGSVSLQAVMECSDYALASTQPLADQMAPYVISKRAFLHRNALSRTHETSCRLVVDRPARSVVRLFYGSGTKAHNEDFDRFLAEPLARLLAKYSSGLEVFIMGYLALPRALKPYLDQITVHQPIWNVTSYWNILREMDISVAVLKPGIVADCKSEIKWLEAGMLSVPSVLSATQTYKDVIKQNKTGVLVSTPDEWFEAVDGLVTDANRRKRIGKAARKTVLESYSRAALSSNLKGILESITEPDRAP